MAQVTAPNSVALLDWLLLQKRVATPAMSGAVDAKVVSATASAITFTVPAFDPQATFSARYEPRYDIHGVQLIPTAGTTCLALFVGSNVGDAWIVAFAGWPAS